MKLLISTIVATLMLMILTPIVYWGKWDGLGSTRDAGGTCDSYNDTKSYDQCYDAYNAAFNYFCKKDCNN